MKNLDEVWDELKEGQYVETNGGDCSGFFTGIIIRKRASFIEIERDDGVEGGGSLYCEKHTWYVGKRNDVQIRILGKQKSSNSNIMSSIKDFFRNLTISAEDKLLKEVGIEDPVNVPTALGLELSADITYQKNREEIIKLAKQMKEEEEKKEKK